MFSSAFNLSEFGRSGTAPINKPSNAALYQGKGGGSGGSNDKGASSSASATIAGHKEAGGGLRRPKTTTENITDNVIGDLNLSLRLNRLRVSSDIGMAYAQNAFPISEEACDEGDGSGKGRDDNEYERKFAQMLKTNDYNNAKESLSSSSNSGHQSSGSKAGGVKSNSWITNDALHSTSSGSSSNNNSNQQAVRVTTTARQFVHKKVDYSLYLDSEILYASSSGDKAKGPTGGGKKLSSSLGSQGSGNEDHNPKGSPNKGGAPTPHSIDCSIMSKSKSSGVLISSGDPPSSSPGAIPNKNSPTTRSDTAASSEGEAGLKIVGEEPSPTSGKASNRPTSRKLYLGSRKSKSIYTGAGGSSSNGTNRKGGGGGNGSAGADASAKAVSLSANSRLRHKSYSTEYLLYQDDNNDGGSSGSGNNNNPVDGTPDGSADRSFRRNSSYGGTGIRSANSIYSNLHSRGPYAEYRPPSRQSSAFPTHLADRPSRNSSRGSAFTGDDDFLLSEEGGARGVAKSAPGVVRGSGNNDGWSRGAARETVSSDGNAFYGYNNDFHNPVDDGFTILDSGVALPFAVQVSADAASSSHTWRSANKQLSSPRGGLDISASPPALAPRRSHNEVRYGGPGSKPSVESAQKAAAGSVQQQQQQIHQVAPSSPAPKTPSALYDDDDVDIYSDDSSGEYELETFDAKGSGRAQEGPIDLETSLDTDFLSLFAN